MAILSTGNTFGATDTVTNTKLNNIADAATFDDPVDNSTLELHTDGKLRIKDGGITPVKLSAGGPIWNSDITYLSGGGTGANIELYSKEHSVHSNSAYYDANIHAFRDLDGANESLRISSEGKVSVGSTSFSNDNYDGNSIKLWPSSGVRISRNTVVSANQVSFYNPNGQVGFINSEGNSTHYSTTSDYRLKEDIVEMEGSIDRLKALKPCNFKWKSDGTRVDGFIAHEAQEVVPEAVVGTKDAVDSEGKPKYQGIDQAKLVPLLTKALQEAVSKIEALEARVAALESA